MDTLHEEKTICVFDHISLSFFFEMINISNKNCRDKQITILCSVIFFRSRVDYEIMWKNTVESGRPRMKYGA